MAAAEVTCLNLKLNPWIESLNPPPPAAGWSSSAPAGPLHGRLTPASPPAPRPDRVCPVGLPCSSQNTVFSNSIEESDIESLVSCVVKSPQDKVLKWVKFASDFAGNDGKQHTMVANLNQDLSQKSILLGDGLKPLVPDIVVYATLQAFMSLLKDNELQKYLHVLRWTDYIQNVVDFGTTLQKINVTKSVFNPPSHSKKVDKGDAESSSKKAILGQTVADKSNGSADSIDAVLKLEPLSCSYSKICFMTIILSVSAPIRLSNSSVSATVDSYVFHHSFCTF